VRWPQGIHYSIWDENDWTAPVLAYLIRQNATEEFAGRIHASHVRLAINTDDQIILIFKAAPSEPQSVLFAMHQDLAEAPSFVPVDVSAEPALVPTALPISTEPVLEPTATSAPPQSFAEEPVPEEFKPPAPGEALWVGLVPAAVVVLGFLLFRLIIRR